MGIFSWTKDLLIGDKGGKIDPALDKILRERGIIDIQGKPIVSAEAVKAKAQQTKAGYDPITNLKKDTTVLPPLATKQALETKLPATEKFTTSPIKSEQKLSPFAAASQTIQQQVEYGKAKNKLNIYTAPEQITKAVTSPTAKTLIKTAPSGIFRTIVDALPDTRPPKVYTDESGAIKVEYPEKSEFKKSLAQESYSLMSGLLRGAEINSRLLYENKEKITSLLGKFSPKYYFLNSFLNSPFSKDILPEDFSKASGFIEGIVNTIDEKSKEKLLSQKDTWQEGDLNKIIRDGEFVPFLASKAIPYIALVSGAGLVGGAGMALGAGSTAVEGMSAKEAADFGASKKTQDIVGIANGVFNAITEAGIFTSIFQKNKPLKQALNKKLLNFAKGFLEIGGEGGQETLQQGFGNTVAKFFYDNERDIKEGLAESFALGTATGLGVKGVVSTARRTQGLKVSAGLSIDDVSKKDAEKYAKMSFDELVNESKKKVESYRKEAGLIVNARDIGAGKYTYETNEGIFGGFSEKKLKSDMKKAADDYRAEADRQLMETDASYRMLKELINIKQPSVLNKEEVMPDFSMDYEKAPETKFNEMVKENPQEFVESTKTLTMEEQLEASKKLLKSTLIEPEVKEIIREAMFTEKEPDIVSQRKITIAQQKNIVNLVKETQKRITDLKLLEQRIKDRFKMQTEVKKKEQVLEKMKVKINDDAAVRDLLVKYLKSKIGAEAEQGEFISLVKNISSTKDEKKLVEAMDRIDEKANKIAIKQAYKREVGGLKSTIAFIKKLGEFGDTAVKDIKKEMDIMAEDTGLVMESWGDATPQQLELFLDILKERLKFKLQHGFEIEGEKRFPTEPTAEMRQKFIEEGAKKTTMKEELSKDKKSASEIFEKMITPITSRLYFIDPSLRHRLVNLEFTKNSYELKWNKKAEGFVKVLKEIESKSKKDYNDLWYALYHGQVDIVNHYMEQYNGLDVYNQFRNVMDEIYEANTRAGSKFDYRKNAFPRVVKDRENLLKYIYGEMNSKSIIDKAIKDYEQKIGRTIKPNERKIVIDKILRGYPAGKVGLSQVGNTKERMIDVLTPEMMSFYHNPLSSIEIYIRNMAEDTATREMFNSQIEQKPESGDMEESMSMYIDKLVQDGKITSDQIEEVQEMLSARFNSESPDRAFQTARDIMYSTTLTSFIHALTQLKDPIRSAQLYGFFNTGKNVIKSFLTKSEIDLVELGLENVLAELTVMENNSAIPEGLQPKNVFRFTFLNTMDKLGKEGIANSAIDYYRELANDPASQDKLINELRKHVVEESIGETIADLKSGEITENLKLLAFSAISKQQPVSLSEYPQYYLQAKNGKLMYAMKAFSLKQLSYIRDDFKEEWNAGRKVSAMVKTIQTIMYLSLWGATIDELKDWLKGKPVDFSDNVINNMLSSFMLSKYSIGNLKSKGLSGLMSGLILPPMGIWDTAIKALSAGEDKRLKTLFKTLPRQIPYVGEMYYWWFGAGSKKNEKKTPSFSGSSKTGGVKRPSTSGGLKRPSTMNSLKRP